VDAVGNASFNIPLATDWKSYLASGADGVKEWLRRGHDKADALARGLEPTAPRVVAEAVRRRIREQVRLEFVAAWPLRENADAVLAEGSGTSMDLALLAVAMLRAKGVVAAPAVFRQRASGSIPAEFPVPALLEDAMVRFMDGTEAVFFHPASDLPVGRLPRDAHGVLAAVFDGKSEAPLRIADFTAADQRVERVTEAELAADGAVAGSTTITLHAVAADRWRAILQPADEEGRSRAVRDRLQRFLPGVVIESLRIDALDDALSPLVLGVHWRCENYATRAGKRTLVSPFLFARLEASDWPPGERTVPVDLGGAYEETDTVTLRIANVGGQVALPGPVRLNAGSVGLYEASFAGQPGVVTAKRHMLLNTYSFAAPAYARLREWFVEIATADAAAVTLTAP
jgi:hypothetical protein